MYKIGDKVEYLNNVWEVCDCEVDNVEIYNEKMGVNIYLPIGDVQPYRTAHDKLIAMGWEQKMSGGNLTLYMQGDLTIYAYKKEKCVICHGTNDSQLTFIINLALSRILTQYLEELD